jgi:hypothetical protein
MRQLPLPFLLDLIADQGTAIGTQVSLGTLQSLLPDLLLYSVTLFGAAAMQVFSLNKGFEGTVPFLKQITKKKRSAAFYARTDFFLTVFLGSFLGYVFFAPDNAQKALAAGLGWVASVNLFLSRMRNNDHENNRDIDSSS